MAGRMLGRANIFGDAPRPSYRNTNDACVLKRRTPPTPVARAPSRPSLLQVTARFQNAYGVRDIARAVDKALLSTLRSNFIQASKQHLRGAGLAACMHHPPPPPTHTQSSPSRVCLPHSFDRLTYRVPYQVTLLPSPWSERSLQKCGKPEFASLGLKMCEPATLASHMSKLSTNTDLFQNLHQSLYLQPFA